MRENDVHDIILYHHINLSRQDKQTTDYDPPSDLILQSRRDDGTIETMMKLYATPDNRDPSRRFRITLVSTI